MSGPCTWPVSYAECRSCNALDNLGAEGSEERQIVEDMAVEFLYRWTGSKFGECPITIRPNRQGGWEWASSFIGRDWWITNKALGPGGVYSSPFVPVLMRSQWFNVGCGLCGDGECNHLFTTVLKLPGPVSSVEEIRIGGQVLDPSAYRIDNYRLLVRTDGGQWPTCQDMSADPTQPNTWLVSYTLGMPVPVGGQVAAGLLACELAKALCGDNTCALPRRVQSVTRQGVTVATLLDTFEDVDKGRTGIWLIDSWVASVTKPQPRSKVYSPDLPRHSRRTTWSAGG